MKVLMLLGRIGLFGINTEIISVAYKARKSEAFEEPMLVPYPTH
jgi:hypothetical protein